MVVAVGDRRGDELGLAARSVGRYDEAPGDRVGDRRAVAAVYGTALHLPR
ncbi:hypothetical protein ACFWNK_02600 [Streptomyces sp. NPDC058417]